MRRNPGGHRWASSGYKSPAQAMDEVPPPPRRCRVCPVVLDDHILPTGGELHLNKRLDALVSHEFDAVGQFIEDRVLHARRTPRRTPEPSVWPTPTGTQPSLRLLRERRGSVDVESKAASFDAGDVVP